MSGRVPPGIKLLRYIIGRGSQEHQHVKSYKLMVLLLTFVAYACYHASRKPPSIVKSVLDPHPMISSSFSSSTTKPWPMGNVFVSSEKDKVEEKGWAPFNNKLDGTAKLGEIDLAFLASYSIGMYVAGHLGDKLDLRLFLTTGMVVSGGFVSLFGMGYFWKIHLFSYFLTVQMLAGLLQATGWPSVVAVVGNWFSQQKRGLIMGVWNAHTSVGNISGSLLAAGVLDYGWGWSFIFPGGLIVGGGILVYLFLVPYPEDIGFTQMEEKKPTSLIDGGREGSAIGLKEACMIPGVIPFALCLFFSKLVAYTFLYWLPFYLSQTKIGGEYMSVKSAGNLSTLFDVGGIFGGILSGYISDRLNARALTASVFVYSTIPTLYLYNRYGGVSQTTNIVLMMVSGLFVNGPYALITTAVSADLGTHSSLRGDSRALATVASIIDGTGSLGAALGPLLTGFISNAGGWQPVFRMLIIGAFLAGILLSSLAKTELCEIISRLRSSNLDRPSSSSLENHRNQNRGNYNKP